MKFEADINQENVKTHIMKGGTYADKNTQTRHNKNQM